MTVMKERGGLAKVVRFLFGGSFLRRFIVYFCICLIAMLLGIWRQLAAWFAGGYQSWAWGTALAILVVFAVLVSLAFASMRAVADMVVRLLAGAAVSRFQGSKKTDNTH